MSLKKSDFTENTIFVSVTKALDNGIVDLDPTKTPLADIARGIWRLDLDKANRCRWLMAVAKDKIIGVWEIINPSGESRSGRWIQVVNQAQMCMAIPTRKWASLGRERRYFCDVKNVAVDVAKKYLHAKMSEIIGLGQMHGPIQYCF